MREPESGSVESQFSRAASIKGGALGAPLTDDPLEKSPSVSGFDLQSFLSSCFVDPAHQGVEVRELLSVPECMRQDVGATAEYLVPSGQGFTSAVGFFATQTAAEGLSRGPKQGGLVILTHGLGQHCCESNWVWIHAFLKAGFHVLAVALDGHSRASLSAFDPRLASRTLPLVLQKISELKHQMNIFVAGHGIGATYSLLAAGRTESAALLTAGACMGPRLTSEGPSEMLRSAIPLRHPLWLCKTALRMGKYYGVGGVSRLWRGESGKLLRKRLFAGMALESQVKMFLAESIAGQNIWEHAKVPVALVFSEKSAHELALLDRRTLNPLVVTKVDSGQSQRSIQFTEEWPQRVARWFASMSRGLEGEEL